MCHNDPLAPSLSSFFLLIKSESGPYAKINQWRVEKLSPPS